MIYNRALASFLVLCSASLSTSLISPPSIRRFQSTSHLGAISKPFRSSDRSWFHVKSASTTSLQMSSAEEIERENAETMSAWLDDMIYSGDMSGFVRRRAADVLCLEFVDYLTKRVSAEKDEDEKAAILEALNLVTSNMDMTDGLGQRSGVAFESRLDQILFAPPGQRKTFLSEIKEDITPGFIEYVQKELKDTSDQGDNFLVATNK